MRKATSIVRVRKISNMTDSKERWVYEIYLQTFEAYIWNTQRKIYGQEIKLYPYKWYELEKFYEIRSYKSLLSHSSGLIQTNTILANKKPIVKYTIRSIVWFMLSILGWIVGENIAKPLFDMIKQQYFLKF